MFEKSSPAGSPTGDYLIAADAVGAGAGSACWCLTKATARGKMFDLENAPVRSVVVGIIDDIVSG